MGLDDRDYMRERHRAGKNTGTKWNEGKARIEAAWYEPTRRGQHANPYRKGLRFATPRGGWLLMGAAFLSYGVHAYLSARRDGYLPDFGPSIEFPKSGTVRVPREIVRSAGMAPFTVVAGDKDAVVRLEDGRSNNAFTLFVRRGETAATRAPKGIWRLQIYEGTRWQGNDKLFGVNTSHDEGVEDMNLMQEGRVIDLRRRFNGNLTVRPRMGGSGIE